MIIPDANLLLYAYDSASSHHAQARAWVEEIFSGSDPVGLPSQTVTAFLRIMTNPNLPGNRYLPEEAIEIAESWLAQPNVRLLMPGEEHWRQLREMVIGGQARGPMVTDAQLAALTLEYGGVLHTTDRDFARFPGLQWVNPIQG